MAKRIRYTSEQIITKLREAEGLFPLSYRCVVERLNFFLGEKSRKA